MEQNRFSLELDVVEPKDKTIITIASIAGSVLLAVALVFVFKKKVFRRREN